MPRRFYPVEEVVGNKIDRAREVYDNARAGALERLRRPDPLALARQVYDQAKAPILESLKQAPLSPVGMAGSLGQQAGQAIAEVAQEDPVQERLALARRTFEEATEPVRRGFGLGEASRAAGENRMVTATPAEGVGQALDYLSAPVRDTLGPIGGRIGRNVQGGRDLAQMAGATPEQAGAVGAGLSVLGVLPATAGATMEQGSRNVGLSAGVSQGIGNVAEALSPSGFRGDVFGPFSRGRMITAGTGVAAGGVAGAVAAPEDASPVERGLSALTGAGAGLQVGSAAPDIVRGAQAIGRRVPTLGGAAVGAGAGAMQDEDASPLERVGRAAVGAGAGALAAQGVRALADAPSTLERLRLLRIAGEGAGEAFSDDLAGDIARVERGITRRLGVHQELTERQQILQEQLGALQELAAPGMRLEKPPNSGSFAGRPLAEGDLYEIAQRSGVNPHEPGWWQQIDAETVRLYRQEAQSRRGPLPPTPREQVQTTRREIARATKDMQKVERELEVEMARSETIQSTMERLGIRPPQEPGVTEPLELPDVPQPAAPRRGGQSLPGGRVRLATRPGARAALGQPQPFQGPEPALPEGTFAQGPLDDAGRPVAPGRMPEAFPENAPLPAAPQEGVGVLAPGRGMAPPTSGGRVFPERFPEEPERPGVPISATGRTPVEPPVEVGRAFPENFPPQAPEPEGVGVLGREMPLAPAGREGAVFPERFPAPAAPRPGVAVQSTPRTPLEPATEVGRVFPENFPPPPPGGQVIPPRADDETPLVMTKPAVQARGRLVQEAVAAGRAQEQAEQDADELIKMARAIGGDSLPPEMRDPDPMRTWQWWASKANQLRYSINLLSGPAGAIADVATGGFTVPRLYYRTAVGSAAEAAIGVSREGRASTASQLSGLNRGFSEGWRQALGEVGQILLGGAPRGAGSPNQDVSGSLIPGKAGAIPEFGYRLRMASDVLLSSMGDKAASYSLAYREADRAGLRSGSPEWQQYAERVARDLQATMTRLTTEAGGRKGVKQGGVTPFNARARPDDLGPMGVDYEALAREAFATSRDLSFQREGGSLSKAFAKSRAGTGMSAFVPFFQTLSRMAQDTITADPVYGTLGAALDVGRARIGEGPYALAAGRTAERGRDVLARSSSAAVLPLTQRAADISAGLMIASAGWLLASQGLITDSGPADSAVRRRMMDEGWRPASLRTPGGYMPINRITGIVSPLLMKGADQWGRQQRGENWNAKDLRNMFLQEVRGVGTQASMREVYEMLNAVMSPDPDEQARSWDRVIGNFTGQWLPGAAMLRTAEQATDQVQRDPRSAGERIMAGIPGVSGAVQPRRTETGQVVARGPGETGIRALLPLQEFGRVQGQRKFYGSQSAQEDAEITRAINAMEDYQREPRQYERPTERQQQLYYRFRSAGNRRYAQARGEETARRRERQVEEGEPVLGVRFRAPR